MNFDLCDQIYLEIQFNIQNMVASEISKKQGVPEKWRTIKNLK